MKPLSAKLENTDTGLPVAASVYVADTWWSRLRGLIGRPPLRPGDALWIRPCSQIHTHFMQVPIHVIFLDAELKVLRVINTLHPWRLSPWVREARSVLELSAAAPLPITVGQTLRVRK